MPSIVELPNLTTWSKKIPKTSYRDEIHSRVLLARLILKTMNGKHTLQRKNSRVTLLIDENTYQPESSIHLLLRRIGFSSPDIPNLDIMKKEAWLMTEQEEAERLSNFIHSTLTLRIPDPLFQAIVEGVSDYGKKIESIRSTWDASEGFKRMRSIWRFHHPDSPPVTHDEFLLSILEWFFQMEISKRVLLIQDIDPDSEWFHEFQPFLLAHYENHIRSNMALWVENQGHITPAMLPDRVSALAVALQH